MKTKILIVVLSIGLFTVSTVKAQEKPKMKVEQLQKASYACPMHCEGEKTYDEQGACPKCKMDLKKVADAKSPQCCAGMKMDSTKMGMECKMNHDKMNETYTCPMHGDVKSDKPGACPKCGMDLKKMNIQEKDINKKHRHQ
jgi:Cu2+-exporting ATPase